MRLPVNSSSAESSPTYFIADIAANHDGSLDRALLLIDLAAEAGADAAKFQNFRAETIVSDAGFFELGEKLSHQKKWKSSVFEVYKNAELPIEWTEALIERCRINNIDYFTAPYDLDFIDYFSSKMPYFKVGSGDITWKQSLEKMASFGKPILLATGASTLDEVKSAMKVFENSGCAVILMQCNTNYTGNEDNFNYINLKVLENYRREFPNAVLGLSDHSQGFIAVLGAVALGARVIEKHFTDDTSRIGPDHEFSLNQVSWSEMVKSTRILERCLGDGVKRVENNELEARIVQRRGYRYSRDIQSDTQITESDLIALRPCPEDGITPFKLEEIMGRRIRNIVKRDQQVRIVDFVEE
jgi:sialic acid synthase SpsE